MNPLTLTLWALADQGGWVVVVCVLAVVAAFLAFGGGWQ